MHGSCDIRNACQGRAAQARGRCRYVRLGLRNLGQVLGCISFRDSGDVLQQSTAREGEGQT